MIAEEKDARLRGSGFPDAHCSGRRNRERDVAHRDEDGDDEAEEETAG